MTDPPASNAAKVAMINTADCFPTASVSTLSFKGNAMIATAAVTRPTHTPNVSGQNSLRLFSSVSHRLASRTFQLLLLESSGS
jgi:hypothetical protein